MGYKHPTQGELYHDGTRKSDNAFQRLFDTGASQRKTEAQKFESDTFQAGFGRGPLAGKTGDVFKDDPFFNPWAKGGRFNP